jgi:hypothetical protein
MNHPAAPATITASVRRRLATQDPQAPVGEAIDPPQVFAREDVAWFDARPCGWYQRQATAIRARVMSYLYDRRWGTRG